MQPDMRQSIEDIRRRIERAAERSGRAADDILLVAVSKGQPYASVRRAYELGIRDFGENRVQELLQKKNCEIYPHRWHLIGQLQRNKVKYIIDGVRMIHSVDRLSLAEEIQRQAARVNRVVPVLVQVNIGSEPAKGGVEADQLDGLLCQAARLDRLDIQGLMAIPPALGQESARPYFRRMRALFEQVGRLGIPGATMRHLSMGMSDDFECAIEEGATIVRVGTALFGSRE